MLMCCLSCAKADSCEQADRVEDYCINHEERPMTNADRIRQMSDEELARFINFHTDCENCPAARVCEDNYALSSDVCMAGIQKWLKQEVTE